MFGSPLFLVFSSKKLLFLMIWRIRITLPLQGCSVLDQQIQVLKPSHLGQGSLKGPIQGSIMFHPLTSTSPSRLIALSFSGHRNFAFKAVLRARQLSRLWWNDRMAAAMHVVTWSDSVADARDPSSRTRRTRPDRWKRSWLVEKG